jgi:hypothetical protein
MTEAPTQTKVVWPGSGAIADGVPDGWHTISRAAALVGRDKDTLKRWHRDGVYEPSGYCERGKLTVWLYSDDDIMEMQRLAHTRKAGRPPKEEANAGSSREGDVQH